MIQIYCLEVFEILSSHHLELSSLEAETEAKATNERIC